MKKTVVIGLLNLLAGCGIAVGYVYAFKGMSRYASQVAGDIRAIRVQTKATDNQISELLKMKSDINQIKEDLLTVERDTGNTYLIADRVENMLNNLGKPTSSYLA